ncbi:hypothetical protein ASG49_03295 [Marmoricola sp. Leaf446]|uniref:hypothetical protein n=1 Tax=Marmoricola sp. Leaf446 TaxID=1736379 RepID=UPI0007010333|nr:hypothetical protein [Marmoricola sp. Leaf446]KQT93981.1 hypothetical protein ASG49_03295 [Marmoricola sp. Leaf446]
MSPKARTDESTPRRTSALSQHAVRTQVARVVRIVFIVLAVVLALGALLVVLRDSVNEQNTIVKLVTDVAEAVSGPFSKEDGIFDFAGKNAAAKNALVNWGIAAVVYLVLGRVLAGVIEPKGKA